MFYIVPIGCWLENTQYITEFVLFYKNLWFYMQVLESGIKLVSVLVTITNV